jgi:hypothetical protein
MVGRVVPAQSPSFTPAVVEGSHFEYGIRLLGLDIDAEGVLTLYWQTDEQVPADFTLFLHIFGADGAQVAAADGPPLNSDWPTSAWVPGQPFADVRRISLPPGRYSVHLGFYDPASGARISAFRHDGTQWRDEVVVLRDVLEIK